ncbi:small GTP-binding protein, putative [Trichomonas vaginalis G3]|uniref:Small GTP-binding protein, putative n=1 Tax=Trichomonas vaginalis (strain ATCC PRA-98 / G3) TaxID=412133 RepID=A2E9G3_TRIV3|nr:GTPase protein [Trichomonas vaginalis G3]EAY10727.1 small GTP-binding protein, putative [Trichomonas vaginalis G3]KAI5538620.1 GTPase protein [Trichomonas vaginalis G3]|eukprot:XP_001322950.1 small GTP-binding protein [Trichomonas vaginalis G3]
MSKIESYVAKVVFIGDASVGKTTIINSLVNQNHADQNFDFDPTIGPLSHQLKIGDKSFILWDTAGQERFRSVAPLVFRGANLIFIVCSTDFPTSLNGYKFWLDTISRDEPSAKIKVLLNKMDLETHKLTYDTLCQEAHHDGLECIGVSAYNGMGLDLVLSAIQSLKVEYEIVDEVKLSDQDKNNAKNERVCC